MESDGDDLENIFKEYENNDNEDRTEDTENKTANETPGAVKIAAPKRIIKNPRLKFNAERLCGERGIPVLVDHFKNVKFKGPGHEKEDLDKLLSKLEHWTHRLFPSMKFEDCLTHIERLGKKRPVQTCLRKIRLDMPILSSDFVKDKDDDDDVKRNENFEPEETNAFDRLLGENQEASNIDDPISENVSNTSSFYSSSVFNDTTAHVLGSSFGSSLTEEQKERMERNKLLAAERRKARLAAMEQKFGSYDKIFSENVLSEQNSLNKSLHLIECTEENAKENSDLEASHDIDKSSKKSSILDCDNSEKLGLDDLINLVDQKEPAIEENVILPSEKNESLSKFIIETNIALSDDVENFRKFQSVSECANNDILPSTKSKDSSKENLSMESSFNLICETSVNIKKNSDDVGCSVNTVSISDETVLTKNKDLFSVNCKNKNSDDNVNEIKEFQEGDKFESFDRISENTNNIFFSNSKGSEKSPKKISNMESSLNLVCEVSVGSKLNTNTGDSEKNTSACDKNMIIEKDGDSVKNTSTCDENMIIEDENLVPMDCEDENF